MFQKALDALKAAGFKAAVKRRSLVCPSCGSPPEILPESPDAVLTCAQCGTAASAREWASLYSGSVFAGNPDRPPASTRITRIDDNPGLVIWNIPATGRSGGLLFFGILWCSFTAIFTLAIIFGSTKASGGKNNLWAFAAFISVFWAVGLGMVYAGCRAKYARHLLSVDARAVTLRRELFGRIKDRSVPVDSIQSIAAVEFYQQNYQPVHGVEIRGAQGKIRFGSSLTDEEKGWLVADLKRVVFGESAAKPVSESAGSSSAPSENFAIPVPKGSSPLLVLGGIFTFGGVMGLIVGYFVILPRMERLKRPAGPSGSGSGFPFDFFGSGFQTLWIVLAVLSASVGIWLILRGLKTRRQSVVLEGTATEIVVRTTQSGRVVESRVFPRADVVDLRASVNGSMNGRPMKRVELIAVDKAQTIASWMDGEKADAFVEEARRALRG